jgi:hypothetical protein
VGAGAASVSAPQFLFAAVPNSIEGPGTIDVIAISSGFTRFDTDPFLDGVQSIQVPSAVGLMDFIRQ